MKNHKNQNILNLRYQTSSWFGSSSYCEKLGVPFRDNSLEKNQKLNQITLKNLSKLKTTYKTLNSSLSLHRSINSKVDLYSQNLSSYFASVSQLETELVLMESAATTIQRYFRGYLARVTNSQSLIQVSRNLLSAKSAELEASCSFFLFKFGRNLARAAIKLQKAVRVFLFKRKLKRFELYYESVLFQRDKLKMEKLIKLGFVLFSKFKLNHAKYLRIKAKKLTRIRRRLAVLRIKQVVIREKINLKKIKISIRKYKRRITMGIVQRTENEEGEDGKSNKTEEEAKMARMRMIIEMEEKRRNKIKLGKISYKVQKMRNFKVKARIRKSQEEESSDGSGVGKSANSCLPVVTPEPKLRKREDRFKYLKSNFMGTTQSFELSVRGPAWLHETESERPKIELKKLRKTIYMPTQFSAQKVKTKKVFSVPEKPSWSSNPVVKDPYVPSIFTFSSPQELKSKIYFYPKPAKRLNKSEFGDNLRVEYENKYVRALAFTPVSARFEEVLPELSRFSKLYSANKSLGTQLNDIKAKKQAQ